MGVDELAERAQQAAEEHLRECWDAYYAAEDEPNPEKWPESPAQAPFCGCETCLVREVLHAAWAILAEPAERYHRALAQISDANSGVWGQIAHEALRGPR